MVEATSTQTAPTSKSLKTDSDFFDAWFRIDREREEGTVREMRNAIRDFRTVTKTPIAALTRLDISSYRDNLLNRRLARATVAKRVGFISTLLQVAYDAGMLPQNVARGLKIPRAKVPTLVRRSFTTEELRRVFSSAVYSRDFRPIAGAGEACVWMPMVALVTVDS
ncbi:phage integrase SAM-like domain-containing protein [Parazoarcus communis]|uniref:phage integrase SAM-like domain-containing protein n=1 Tax=Parazoarcus communis TaxID=41977 RepID=UPI00131F0194|nr:phage integrase SAM-like domain-containing protein [Parazoarcus communis]